MTLGQAAAATLTLASCGSLPEPTPGAASVPSDSHHSHPSAVPTGTSPSATEEHSEHTDHDESEPVGGHDHEKRDDSYKDVKLVAGSTYTIQSSTDETLFKLTIESFECKDPFPDAAITSSGKPAPFEAAAGKTLCVAMVSGKNVGERPDHAALNYFVVALTKDGKEHEETDSPDFTTYFLMGDKTPLNEPVDPAATGWMALGYELPDKQTKDVLLRIDTAPPSS
jgi:hypothetical protein